MATITWTNPSGGDWLDAENWSSGTVPAETDTADITQPGSYTITAAVFAGRVGSVLVDDPNAMLQVQGLTLVNALTLQAGILDFGQGGLSGTVLATGGSLEVGQLANFTNVLWVGDFDLNHGFVIASGFTVEAAGGGAGTIAVNSATLHLAGPVGGGNAPGTISLANAALIAGGDVGDIGSIIATGSNDILSIGTVDPGTTLTAIAGSTSVDLGSSTGLDNEGVIEDSGSGETISMTGEIFSNAGRIDISNGASFIAYSSTFENTGTITVSSGGTLAIQADATSWSGSGPIVLDPTATLELDGSIIANTPLLSAVAANGGTLVIGEYLDNTGSTLVLGPSPGFGELLLDQPGATILGGTVDVEGGTILSEYGTFDGVVLPGSLSLGLDGVFTDLGFADGVLVRPASGPKQVGLTGSSTEIDIIDAQTLDGFQIDDRAASAALVGFADLTLSADTTITVLGGTSVPVAMDATGSLVPDGLLLSGDTLVNNGVITDTIAAGYTLTLDGNEFDNAGSVAASGTGNAVVVTASDFSNTGTLSVSDGADLYLNAPSMLIFVPGSFINSGRIDFSGNGTLTVGGSVLPGDIAGVLSAGSLALVGTLDNTGSTLSLVAGGPFGDLMLGSMSLGLAGTIQGGTVDAGSGIISFPTAVLDGVTWIGDIALDAADESLNAIDGTVLQGSGGGPETITLTGDGDSIGFDGGTLDNAVVRLEADSGTVTLAGPTTGTLTLGSATRLIANAGTGGMAVITGNIANHGLLDTGAGTVELGGFSSPNDPVRGMITFDNTGTLLAMGGAGSTLVVGDQTGFSNEGLIQVGSGEELDVAAQTFANSGTLSVGAGGTAYAGNQILVGTNDTGPGVLRITGGGKVVVTDPLHLVDGPLASIAASAGTDGSSATVTGPTSTWSIGGTLIVGDLAAGALDVSAGGSVTATALTLGNSASGVGNLSLSGTTSNVTLASQLTVGGAGIADISIANGATLAATDGDIGLSAGASGVIDIEGAGSRLDLSDNLNIGDAGTGVLIMGVGTTLSVENNLNIGAAGALDQFGGVIDPATGTIQAGGSLGGAGGSDTFSNFLLNDGVFYAASGLPETLNAGSITGSGSLVVENGGTLVLNAGTVLQTQLVEFTNSSSFALLNIGSIGGFSATIGSFNGISEILLQGASIAATTFDGSDDVLSLFSDLGKTTQIGTLNVSSSVTGGNLTALETANAQGGLGAVPCFAAGTRIMTARGLVAVEALCVGDRVRLAPDGPDGAGWLPVVWIGRREVDCRHHPKPRAVWPVRVRAGAFGAGCPGQDVYFSPDHAVYADGVLIPVKYLLDEDSVAQVAVDQVAYFHVELERHAVLLAEGLAAESYLDTGDRSSFINGGGAVRLHPDFASLRWEAHGCAPLVVTGKQVEEVKARVKRAA